MKSFFRCFAGAVAALVIMAPASAQIATRTASADDLAIARMESGPKVRAWGDAVSKADQGLVGCFGYSITPMVDEDYDEEYVEATLDNTCAFPLVMAGTVGAVKNGACVSVEKFAERNFAAGGKAAWEPPTMDEPCLYEVTRLGVAGSAVARPQSIDAAVAVLRRVSEAGKAQLFNKSGPKEAAAWEMLRQLSGLTVINQCFTRFEAPTVVKSTGQTPAKYLGIDWREISIVRLGGTVAIYQASWMKEGEIGAFAAASEQDAADLVRAFETLALKC